MSFLTSRVMLRTSALRSATIFVPRTRLQARFATQGYGDGDGNPVGEKPQQQGKNPSEDKEHPGPPPPEVAKGQSSSSPNNSDGKSSSSTSSSKNPNSNPSNKRSFSTSARRLEAKDPAVSQGQRNQPKPSEVKNAQPKILHASPPSEKEESEDVKRHNREMSNRAEQAHEKVGNADTYKDQTAKK